MEKLGRYYTADKFSDLLINSFSNSNPKNVLELGVGSGSLLKAALNRWVLASYYATDIDKKSINKIRKEFPFVKTFHLDTLKEDLYSKINVKEGSFDIAICNPPYLKLENNSDYKLLFEQSLLQDCINLKLVTTDIVFLAKNLHLLKSNGELGIILPDSLITGQDFSELRKAILEKHAVKGIIQLPERIFPKTDALTHILLVEKQGSSQKEVPLFLSDNHGHIIDQIQVDQDLLLKRMDFKYHLWSRKSKPRKKKLTLSKINAEIHRGNLTHNELKNFDSYVHTTTIDNMNVAQIFRASKQNSSNNISTKKGDILLSRVGRKIKVCKVLRGQAPISDCVYRIRVKEKYLDRVWRALISVQGQNYLAATSHGVCAKVISKKDLLGLPI